MIISRTPLRISFFGGGTDYPTWLRKHGGQVVATTIDKYLYISCRKLPPFFEHKLNLRYSIVEYCKNANELTHPSAKQVLKYLKLNSGLVISYDGDLPGRGGLGSSSAFTVGLLNALLAYKKQKISKYNLAKKSIYIEQDMIKEAVGSQDQVNVTFGGFNHIKFKKNNDFVVSPLKIKKKQIKSLENNLLLFFTGINRIASNIAEKYMNKLSYKEKTLYRMSEIVTESIDIIENGDLNDFGKLLHQNWIEKKSISKLISNQFINEIYDIARSAGALGGKILGAGGGGFILFYVPINKQRFVKKKLHKLLHIPFKFENTGSKIIYNDNEK